MREEKTVEQLYQAIGLAATSFAPDLAGKLLLYAEAEEGVMSADMFYETASGSVRFRFSSDELQQLIYSFWETWKATPGNEEWRTMCYTLNGGKFAIDLQYADQVNPAEEVSDRRPRVVSKYFGSAIIDYSRP